MELDSGVRCGEAPGDRAGTGVAVVCPGRGFGGEGVTVANAPVETLTGENAQLDLGHVQPATMLRRIVHLQLLPEPPRRVRRSAVERRCEPLRDETAADTGDRRETEAERLADLLIRLVWLPSSP